MLRAIRHKLRQIRYYSAPRRRTMWTAATDTALWLALLLAIPFTAASLWVPRDSSVRFSLEGVLLQPERGEFEARVMNPDTEVGTWKPQEPFGMFVLSQSQRQWGWPFPVQIDVEPVELLLDIFNQPQPQRRAQLSAEDPIRLAIEAALLEADAQAVLEQWQLRDPPATHFWWGWVSSSLIWWALLSIVGVAVARTLVLFFHLGKGHRASRRQVRLRSGRCATCGYNLQGLEFSERCPECGSLTY